MIQTNTPELSMDQLNFLAQLPLLLNSSLDRNRIIQMAIDNVKRRLDAEAATVFLLSESGEELTFWALLGGDNHRLQDMKIPANKGVVGWVIEHQEATLIPVASEDQRFFGAVDDEGDFNTRDMICVPLTSRGDNKIGAFQILNKREGTFDENDLFFARQFANQLSLAIINSVLHERLQIKNTQLESLDRRKNEVSTVIAHEFRTPLNIIQNCIEMLASGTIEDPETKKSMMSMLRKGTTRLSKLVAQIKDLTLVNEDSIELNTSRIHFNLIIERCAAHFHSALKSRKIELVLKLDSLNPIIEADPFLLSIVMNNLISNAIRFTPDNGTITIFDKAQTGMLDVAISDTGIGIDPEEQTLIFETFYEVTDSMEHSSGDYEFMSAGLGIGLATARAILKAHGSEISIKSELKTGSTFTFSLALVD